MTQTNMPSPLVLTDDEIMALAAVSGLAWWTALRSVDVASDSDMITASARGLRSLAVRSLISADGAPSEDLTTALTCLGARPWAAVAVVDGEDRVVDEAPVLLVFRGTGDGVVACRSDVSGTHLLHELHLDHVVELIAEQLSGAGARDVAAAFWSTDLTSLGGLRRRGDECVIVDRSDAETSRIPASGSESQLLEAVRSFWQDR